MNTHDVGRDRGGVAAALSRVKARALIAGVDSDRLYPVYQAQSLAAGIPGAGEAVVISSPHGHDSFLIETDQIAALVKSLLG
jgi:homoserine O-acetyltransferase